MGAPPPTDPGPDKLPPHSIEAEQGVLGCLLLSPADGVARCIQIFKGGPAVFYDHRHRAIYEHIVAKWDANIPIDIITLRQSLDDVGQLESVGGLGYLAGLPNLVPSAENLQHYAEIVANKYVLRRLLVACAEITNQAFAEPKDPSAVVGGAVASIQTISEISVPDTTVGFTKELVNEALDHIEHLQTHASQVAGLSTRLSDLDSLTWGLADGEMIVLAARPSVGKTSLAMNMAEHVAVEQKQPVAVFSMEMTKRALMVRMLCSRARVDGGDMHKGYLTNAEQTKLLVAGTAIANAPLYIDDSSALSIIQLRARAKRMHQMYGIKLFVIDYLQLMNAGMFRAENRQQEVTLISSGIKALAKELKVPVIAISQLKRTDEREPRLSDLRESGSLEQDADIVILLYKHIKESTTPTGVHQDIIPVKALIAKHRNGPTGEVSLLFIKSFTKFEQSAKPGPEIDEQPTLLNDNDDPDTD